MAKPVKRVVIKEEYVALTGDYVCAVLLNQMDYWAKRCYDIDKYLTEEKTRAANNSRQPDLPYTHGWIHKSAKELAAETMMTLTDRTVRSKLIKLVDNGWISERNNTEHKWDHTTQYRFNAARVAEDLNKLGYPLEGWTFNDEPNDNRCPGRKPGKSRNDRSENFSDRWSAEPSNSCNDRSEKSSLRAENISDHSENVSDRDREDFGTIPEIIHRDYIDQQQLIGDHRSIVDRANSDNNDVVVGQSIQIISLPEPDERQAATQIKSGAEKKEIGTRPENNAGELTGNPIRPVTVVASDMAPGEVRASRRDLSYDGVALPDLPEPTRNQLHEIIDLIKDTAGVKFTLEAARALFYAGKGDMERVLKALKGAGTEYRRRKGGKDRVHNEMGWFVNAVIKGFVPAVEDKYQDISIT
jgi:hypothetical protein